MLVDRNVVLDAAGSSDDQTPSGELTYTWSKGDGGAAIDARGEKTSVTFAEPGRYGVTLTVTDAAGNSSSTTEQVRVLRYVACTSSEVDLAGWGVARDLDAIGTAYCSADAKRGGRHVISFSFAGQQLQLLHGKAKRGGFAQVLIDGKARKQLSFRSRSAKGVAFHTLRTFGNLGGGTHDVQVVLRKAGPRGKQRGYFEGFVVRR